jgi:hypothetical protein
MKQQDNRQDQRKSASGHEAKSGTKGDMSVREAGHKGGQRERELVSQGRQSEKRGK